MSDKVRGFSETNMMQA